jgi:hypothetical protein
LAERVFMPWERRQSAGEAAAACMIPKKPALGLDPRVADFSDKIMHQIKC